MTRLLEILVIAAVSMTTADPQVLVDEKGAEALRLPCPSRSESSPETRGLPDLSSQGLVFDPLAPGGVRPKEQRTEVPALVNSGATTLFPALRPTEQSKPKPKPELKKEYEIEKDLDCRA